MKAKVYLRCTMADGKSISIKGCPNVGVEFLGMCHGVALDEEGVILGGHCSSTLDWLRSDLLCKFDKDKYDVVDMIDEDVSKL